MSTLPKTICIFQVGKIASVLLLSSMSVLAEVKPQVIDTPLTKNCQFISSVEGSSGYGKNYDWTALAKQAALNKAEKLGASHLVWGRFYPVGAFNGIVAAKAYSCNL